MKRKLTRYHQHKIQNVFNNNFTYSYGNRKWVDRIHGMLSKMYRSSTYCVSISLDSGVCKISSSGMVWFDRYITSCKKKSRVKRRYVNKSARSIDIVHTQNDREYKIGMFKFQTDLLVRIE